MQGNRCNNKNNIQLILNYVAQLQNNKWKIGESGVKKQEGKEHVPKKLLVCVDEHSMVKITIENPKQRIFGPTITGAYS